MECIPLPKRVSCHSLGICLPVFESGSHEMFAEKLLPLDLQALQIFQVLLFFPNPSQVHSHCLKLILMIQLLGVSPLKSTCHQVPVSALIYIESQQP